MAPSDGPETAVRPVRKPRRLHPSWIDAGQRRRVARSLRRDGWTYREIADVFQISPETARRDCR